MSTTRFEGFPKAGLAFFAELAFRQDREWFKAHKADYEQLWEAPMKAFVEEVQAKLSRTYPALKTVKPKHFRIYRDVRFSKDKAPYKTSISALLPLSGDGEMHMDSGLYFEFGKESFVAMGRWMMEPELLARFRTAVDAEKTGAPFAALVAKAKTAGFTLGAHEALKRVPKPFDPEHPRAELLKQKGFAMSFPKLSAKELASPKLVDRVAKEAASLAPLMKSLEAAVSGRKAGR